MIQKGGAAHVEMIVSFIFFAAFVFFLFLTIKPYSTTTLSSSIVEELHDTFQKNAETNLTEAFLKVEYTGSGCFFIELSDKTFIYKPTVSKVEEVDEGPKNSGVKALDLHVEDSGQKFYRTYFSPEFNKDSLSDCTNKLTDTEYTFGSILERKAISYKTLEAMNTKYKDDYQGLKKDLNVPDILDFAITSEELDDINMEGIVPQSSEAIAQEWLFEVLKDDGTIINARINFRVW